ncbi:MAG: DNA repair protein RecN, partial [Limisphaerales bacterium]
MLTTLRIKNLALVTDLTLELQAGCNVITGETGAGKSIIIGALNLVLGERADRGQIRAGEDSCTVEAVFDVASLRAPLRPFLEESGLEPCQDNQLVLKRAFTGAGANRQFINGSPTTLGILGRIGEWLVDMHGPHDHQSLLFPAKQLSILDAFGRLEPEREAFGEMVRRRCVLEREKSALIVDENTYAQQLDLLRFQTREIVSARLRPGEETAVEEEFQRANNGARLLQLSQAALDGLDESENSLLTQAGAIGRTLLELQRVDPGGTNLMRLHSQAVAILAELKDELSRYVERISVDPARLAELGERLDLIQSLKHKYGAGIEEINAFAEQAQKKLQSLESRDAELARINSELKKLDDEILTAGQALSARRKRVIPQLAKAVGKQLEDLGFRQALFNVAIKDAGEALPSSANPGPARSAGRPRFSSTGLDEVEFEFAPNPGEPAR